uniref:Ubiquitin-like protease family profile domain-containing protein n=1 Tax=Opuntia streptacantha TaxID=393608 RepID=A0A7C9AB45_OPUST
MQGLQDPGRLTRAKLATVGYMVAAALPAKMPDGLQQVLLPLYDEHARHWLLLRADLQERSFFVYDSCPASRASDNEERKLLVHRASTAVALPLMQSDLYGDALTWEKVDVDCPSQSKVPQLRYH